MSGAIPWRALLREAVRRGVSPESFWRLSLAEWRLLTGDSDRVEQVRWADFAALAERFPDSVHTNRRKERT